MQDDVVRRSEESLRLLQTEDDEIEVVGRWWMKETGGRGRGLSTQGNVNVGASRCECRR